MSFNLASAMLNSKIRPRAVVGYGVKIFHLSPPNYVTRSPGMYCIVTIRRAFDYYTVPWGRPSWASTSVLVAIVVSAWWVTSTSIHVGIIVAGWRSVVRAPSWWSIITASKVPSIVEPSHTKAKTKH